MLVKFAADASLAVEDKKSVEELGQGLSALKVDEKEDGEGGDGTMVGDEVRIGCKVNSGTKRILTLSLDHSHALLPLTATRTAR